MDRYKYQKIIHLSSFLDVDIEDVMDGYVFSRYYY
jgi:hypothetical protein